MAQPQGTLDQTVAWWLKLKPQEIKDFSFKEFEISLSDYQGYRKKLSEATEAVRATFYTAYEKVYNDNRLARPLLLKYIFDEERDVIEEIVTENFVKNLAQEISKNYGKRIKEKSKKLEECKDDEERLKKPESQRLTQDYKQYSSKIQNHIDQLEKEIETIKNCQKQLATYDTYTDKIKRRDQTLLHAEKYTPNILHDIVSTEVEKKFTEYLKQLNPEKTKEAYAKIDTGYIYEGKYNCIGAIKTVPGGIIIPPILAGSIILAYGMLCMGYTLFTTAHKMSIEEQDQQFRQVFFSNNTTANIMYASLIVSAVLCVIVPLAVIITSHYKKKIFSLEGEHLHLSSEQKVSTPENQEPASTSKLQEISKDQENNVEFQHSNNVNLSGIQDNISIYPSLSNAEEAEGQKNTETQHDPYAPSAPPAEMVNAKVSSQNYNSSKVKLD